MFAGARQSPFRIQIEDRGGGSVQQNPPESAGVPVKLAVTPFLKGFETAASPSNIFAARAPKTALTVFLTVTVKDPFHFCAVRLRPTSESGSTRGAKLWWKVK